MVNILGFLFALARISTCVFLLPLFNMRNIPYQVKIGLSALLALLVAQSVPEPAVPSTLWFIVLLLQEAAVGIALAFVAILVFAFIYFAGQLVDVPMGFGMVSVFDPSTGTQLPVFSQFYHILGSLIFLGVDGHIWLFRALLQSYKHVPVGSFFATDQLSETVMSLSLQLFQVGLQIAIPVMGTIFLTDLALGMVIKTVPQINVFVIGFPIKIAVGLVVIILGIPFYVQTVASLFAYDGILFRHIFSLIMSGGG